MVGVLYTICSAQKCVHTDELVTLSAGKHTTRARPPVPSPLPLRNGTRPALPAHAPGGVESAPAAHPDQAPRALHSISPPPRLLPVELGPERACACAADRASLNGAGREPRRTRWCMGEQTMSRDKQDHGSCPGLPSCPGHKFGLRCRTLCVSTSGVGRNHECRTAPWYHHRARHEQACPCKYLLRCQAWGRQEMGRGAAVWAPEPWFPYPLQAPAADPHSFRCAACPHPDASSWLLRYTIVSLLPPGGVPDCR